MSTVQIVFVFKFLLQIINVVIDFLLNMSEFLLNFFELLSLIWLHLIMILRGLIDEIFQVFYFLDKILSIFDNISCLLDLLGEELTLERLVLLLEYSNLIRILFHQFFQCRQFIKYVLLLF